MKKFKALNIFLRTFIYSAILILIIFLCMIPLIIYNHGDIAYGFVIGGFISYMGDLVLGLMKNKNNNDRKYTKKTVAVMVIRLVILAIVLVVSALLTYLFNIKLFNIFGIVVGYFIPLAVLLLLSVLERKKNGTVQ